MNFLIVQKKSPLRDYLENIIINNGNDFLSIEDEAELNDKYKPDYAILDVDSRNLNGLKFAESLKKKNPGLYLLLISENDDIWLRKKTKNIPDSIFIPKENLHQLEQLIESE